MAIYRGTGSASTTTDQATIDEVTTQATNAANSATSAASSASSAASSASSASSSASTATSQASAASTSATNAASSASAASTSASNAATSATNAATSATTAASEATNAETAETGAVAARAAAESAQTAAETAKDLAEGFKDLAASSASSASSSASTATTKASEASASATAAGNAQTAAEAAQAAAEAAQAAIDGTYLGAQASNPTGDGNGNDVTVGDWYFNTTVNQAYIYNGSTWDALAPDLIGDATPQLGGNLDLNSNDITGTGNINVTGTVTADGLTVESNTAQNVILRDDNSFSGADNQIKLAIAPSVSNGNSAGIAFGTYSDNDYWKQGIFWQRSGNFGVGDLIFATRESADTTTVSDADQRLRIAKNGDISFYEDTGTTAKFFWDSSNESLTLGSSEWPTSAIGESVGRHMINSDGETVLILWDASTGAQGNQAQLLLGGKPTNSATQIAGGRITGVVENASDADGYLSFETTSGVSGFTEKMRIDSSGNVNVTGTVTADGLTVAQSSGANILLESTTTGATTGDIFGEIEFKTNDSNSAGIKGKIDSYSEGGVGNGALRLFTGDTTGLYQRMNISSGGDISFYEDTGTTPKLFWDASAESLGIGTSSPDAPLTVQGGSATSATIQLKGGTSGTDNASIHSLYNLYLKADSSESIANRNIIFQVGSTDAMRIDSSGNVGLGVTPSDWVAGYKVLQVGNASWYTDGNANTYFAANTYQASGFVDRYISSNEAAKYEQFNGAHLWSTASSGTAGNAITWSEAMRIDSSGNFIFNENGNDADFRVEGDTESHALFVRGSDSFVGLGLSNPTSILHIQRGAYGGYSALQIENTNGNAGVLSYVQFDMVAGSSTGKVLLRSENSSNTATDTGEFVVHTTSGGTTSEKMRLDANGNLGVNKTNPTRTVDIEGASEPLGVKLTAGSNPVIRSEHYSSANANWYHIRFFTGLGAGGAILVNGSTGTVTYSTTSDYRLKENVVDIADAIDRLKQLNPVKFNWINAPDGQAVDGFLAHEVGDIVPEAIHGEKDAVDENGDIDPQGIDQAKLVPLLTKALQEAVARIETLEAQVANLQGN